MTPERQRRLCKALSHGAPYAAACAYAGFGYSNFRRYMLMGEKAKSGKFRDFWEAVQRAVVKAELRFVIKWNKHLDDDWRACRDILARRFPKRWGAKTKIEAEHSGKDGGPLVVQIISGPISMDDL